MATSGTKRPRRISLSNAALLLVGSALLSQALGLLRTKLVNGNFSALGPNSTDAYFAAFNIPDFFFFTLAAGALGVAFMPVLADRLAKGDKRGMWDLSTSLLNLLMIIMAGVGVIIFVFAEPLVHYVISNKLTPQQLHNTVTIMRFLAFNPLLFTISGVLTAVQQTLGRFFFYALSPLLYNASIIASIFIFRHNIGLIGLGIGALVGAVLQLLVVASGLFGTNFHWHRKILWRHAEFRLILRQLPPRSLDQGMDQVESIVETHFARDLGAGNISYYNNAYIMSTAPAMLIGTAISTAAFPQLNNRLAQGRPDLFKKDFLKILRGMIWIALPVTVICFFTRGYLAHLIYTENQPQISLIFGYLSLFIFFTTLYSIISRWFYAHKDTITPLIVSVFTILLDFILVYTWARQTSYGIAGLALAQSCAAMMEVIILVVIMIVRDPKLFDREFWTGVGRSVSVTGFSVMAGIIMITLLPLGINDRGFLLLGSKLSLIVGVVMSVHIGVSWLFGLDEVRPIFRILKKVILKPIRVEY
jgi:putative peptidoglycan lipid II flippase